MSWTLWSNSDLRAGSMPAGSLCRDVAEANWAGYSTVATINFLYPAVTRIEFVGRWASMAYLEFHPGWWLDQ